MYVHLCSCAIVDGKGEELEKLVLHFGNHCTMCSFAFCISSIFPLHDSRFKCGVNVRAVFVFAPFCDRVYGMCLYFNRYCFCFLLLLRFTNYQLCFICIRIGTKISFDWIVRLFDTFYPHFHMWVTANDHVFSYVCLFDTFYPPFHMWVTEDDHFLHMSVC